MFRLKAKNGTSIASPTYVMDSTRNLNVNTYGITWKLQKALNPNSHFPKHSGVFVEFLCIAFSLKLNGNVINFKKLYLPHLDYPAIRIHNCNEDLIITEPHDYVVILTTYKL